MAQTARVVNRRGHCGTLDYDLPVVLPKSAPLMFMPETPLEFRVPANAINVGPWGGC